MTTDSGAKILQPKSPDLTRLPDILDVQAKARRFEPPRRVTTNGVDRHVDAGVEIEVKLSEPFVIRALSPVLWIGDTPLTEMDCNGTICRFYAFDPQSLPTNGSIALSWNFADAPRKATRHYYHPPASIP